MMISDDELRTIALRVVSNNQSNFTMSEEESEKAMMYRLAYNDGVLDLMDAIIQEKGDTI